MKLRPSNALVVLLAALLAGCAGGGTRSSGVGPAVGPNLDPGTGAEAAPAYTGVRLDIIVPVFDPGLPEDPDDYADKGIWPELRRTEATRFAVALQEALQATGVFGDVRVTPDAQVTGDLYVLGTIKESNGEDVEIEVDVIDISGAYWMRNREYDHRVKEYFWQDLRSKDADPYQPVFDEAAGDIAELVQQRSGETLTRLRQLTEIRFAHAFSGDSFGEYLEQRGDRVILTGLPDRNDPMLERARAIRIQDGLFMKRMQKNYTAFVQRTDSSYASWQEYSLTEAKALRKAKREARWKGLLGAVLAVGGAIAASQSGDSAGDVATSVLGIGTTAAGAMLIVDAFKKSAEGRAHADALSELGESLNVEVGPQVIALEDKTVELRGDAGEQFQQWRAFLQEIYAEETTPQTHP